MGAGISEGDKGLQDASARHPGQRSLDITEAPALSLGGIDGVSEETLASALDRNDWLGRCFATAFDLAAPPPLSFTN